MKKNKFMRIACTLLVLTLLSTCAISGTFAKYVSEVSGSDDARVAKWAFDFGSGTTTKIGETLVFNLFETVNDTGNAAVEGDVASSDSDTVIAPGTAGSFDIVLTNNSEVTANYTIAFSAVNDGGIPIVYRIGDTGDWQSDITKLNTSAAQLAANGGSNADAPVTINWMWAIGDSDLVADNTTDTNLGLGGKATVTVTAKITVTQVD